MDEKLSRLSDEDLMALYQSGDANAFATLYERHSKKVFAFLQKNFLKMHRSRHQYSTQYPFLPWLFAITRNVVIDYFRLNESKIARESVTDVTIPDEAVSAGTSWAPGLSLALKNLPDNQKRAIELRYKCDWTFEQIADDMKTTPVNIRQVISRGIKKMRSAFGGANE
jgi:RNA polymerase sigma factor (sigma-70 family)